jgi:hypothetical protein
VSDEKFVAYTCDQDAYAYSGQKCSAQSALFAHENWVKTGFLDKLKELAVKRSMKNDYSSGPVLTVTNETYVICVAIARALYDHFATALRLLYVCFAIGVHSFQTL